MPRHWPDELEPGSQEQRENSKRAHYLLASELRGRCNETGHVHLWRCDGARLPGVEPLPPSGLATAGTSRAAATSRTDAGDCSRWPPRLAAG